MGKIKNNFSIFGDYYAIDSIMKRNLRSPLLLFALFLPLYLCGQENRNTNITFDGALKTKLEICPKYGVVRFNVRNSRVGVRGDLGDYMGYRLQIEWSAEGSFAPLDMYGVLKPIKGLSFQLGQTSIPFENSYIITPAEMLFANRAFVGKYFTPGTRDIGVVMSYKYVWNDLPLEAQAGMFNGGKINNPQWTEHPSYAFRLIVGRMDGFRATAKIYHYQNVVINHLFWGADLHYATKYFRVEAEVMDRKNISIKQHLSGGYVQGAWHYYLKKEGMFRHITPALRWDTMGYDVWNLGFDVSRITAGLHFGLSLKPFESVLRLDYEHYFVRQEAHRLFFEGRDLYAADHKVTLELLVKF